MPNENYLALVLSPIMDTISAARKTRELWASSFIFSRMMYHLLDNRPAATTLIAPAFSAQETHKYGAGIYHDRCIIKLPDANDPGVSNWIAAARQALADEMSTTADTLDRLMKIEVLIADWKDGDLDATARGENVTAKTQDKIAIHRVNRLLDNLELRPVYVPREDKKNLIKLLDSKIQHLYEIGFEADNKSIFIRTEGSAAPRLPSIPEIGLRELSAHSKDEVRRIYQEAVELPLSRNITAMKATGGRGKDLLKKLTQLVEAGQLPEESLLDSQLLNEFLFTNLKAEYDANGDTKGMVKFRHKYVAMVRLDGDGLGKAITAISQDDPGGVKFRQFSKRLMKYAKASVKMVMDYGGMPIFAGGDDLLYLAPVAMPENDGPTNVLSLCAELDTLFHKTMNDEDLSLSGGVFIGYYKYPLGEADTRAGELEHIAKSFKVYVEKDKPAKDSGDKWEPRRKKNAIALEVRKHSGQTFGTTFHLRSDSFPLLERILKFDDDIDELFLTSVMHRLQSIPTVLAAVSKGKDLARRQAFREHQFGKGGPLHEGAYLTAVLDYAHAVFNSYGDALAKDEREKIDKMLKKAGRSVNEFDYAMTERVFAALRFKQFLIMPDHE